MEITRVIISTLTVSIIYLAIQLTVFIHIASLM
jgi:hypothetical protein